MHGVANASTTMTAEQVLCCLVTRPRSCRFTEELLITVPAYPIVSDLIFGFVDAVLSAITLQDPLLVECGVLDGLALAS